MHRPHPNTLSANRPLWAIGALVLLAACGAGGPATATAIDDGTAPAAGASTIDATGAHPATPLAQAPFTVTPIAKYDSPWAIEIVPATGQMLITLKGGALVLRGADGSERRVGGLPNVTAGGQGGLGDIIVHGAPDADGNQRLFLSWAAAEGETLGAVVASARVNLRAATPMLEGLTEIWRQAPFTTGRGHFGHRLAISPDGQHLFISSGDRQKLDPAQDMTGNLGKIVRLNIDGSVPADNPFATRGGVTAQIWTLGHRNPLGIAFDHQGRLWNQEMGPAHGDELNLVKPGQNYGWPIVSNGDHYDGRTIPNHDTRPDFAAPALWWNPAISPAGLTFHDGTGFGWGPSMLIGGLSGRALVRVALNDAGASKAERWDMGARVRDMAVDSSGTIWVVTDRADGQLLKLTPR